MPAIDPLHRIPAARESSGPGKAVVAATLLLAATFCVAVLRLPAPLVLPTVCLTALAAAAVFSAVAWKSRAADWRQPTYWDLAGALTFVGMCAAMLSEPDQVMALLETAPKSRNTAG